MKTPIIFYQSSATPIILGSFRKVFLLVLMTSAFYWAKAQQNVTIGTVEDFYSSLKNVPANARLSTTPTLRVKVNSQSYLDVTIHSISKYEEEEVFVGKVSSHKHSHVFFNFKNGEVSGKVLIPEEKLAYDYSSSNGAVSVAPERIDHVLCVEYQQANSVGTSSLTAFAPPPGSNVYTLESLPGAEAVVMLDFDGHTTTGSWWGTIDAQPSSASETDITEAWKLISEDFRPYQLNITTNEAVYQSAPSNRRMRVIFTPTNDAAPGSGGVAFIGSFTSGGELAPCWVYNSGSGKIYGETASHEIGHTVGLLHDGREIPGQGHEEYYGGQGVWAPIMGVGYYREVTHWSRGEYQYANNFEDDIAIIGSQNGFGFRADVQGSTIATSVPLVVNNGVISATSNKGIIADQFDIDMFSFTTPGGLLNVSITQVSDFPDLNVSATLFDSQGQIITTSDPIGISPAVFNLNLASGVYYIGVKGAGEGDPFTDGYSNFSSIGEYSISGNVVSNPNPETCNTYIQQLANGDIQFSVTYPVQKAYVEVFAKKNGLQHLATNIKGSEVHNANGTYTYTYTMPASFYVTGDEIEARFYSYSAGGPGEFTPGPAESVWSEPFFYNQPCDQKPVANCNDYIQQLENGDIKFLVTFPSPQAYVEVFSKTNGIQNIALNIVNSQVNNADGTYSYSYIVPASSHVTGDSILARFYSYISGGPGVFTPGPTSSEWSSVFVYNQTVCKSCNDVYEPNNYLSAAKLIGVNTPISAKIHSSSDVDWFKITTTDTAPNLQITLSNLVVDFDLELYNASGSLIAGSYYGGSTSELINYASAYGADYFIKVYGYIGNHNEQCYQLKATTSGNAFASASSQGANYKFSAKPDMSGNALVISPNPAQHDQEMTVQINNADNGLQTFRIVDLSGQLISEQSRMISGGQAVLSLLGIPPGIYVLESDLVKKQKLVIE